MTPGHSIRGLLLVVACAAGAMQAHAVDVDWVTVGDPGNACDLQSCDAGESCNIEGQGCFGDVPYTYQISRYEVTNAQYTEFLNAADPTGANNPLFLYDTRMGSDATFGGINLVTANPNGSKYVVKSGFATRPVVYVSFFDAMRFANWMHNGQGAGSTEDGAYTLLGGGDFPTNGETVTRNVGATVYVASEDEWYKAAYYDASAQSYDPYPFTDAFDGVACGDPPGGSHSANCNRGSLTDVGVYTGAPSAYGTFDQGGNVREWSDTIDPAPQRVVRGGSWFSKPIPAYPSQVTELSASRRGGGSPSSSLDNTRGFRAVACSGVCVVLPACSDGEDDDGDGATDFPADPGCYSAAAPREDPKCQNGADDDADGWIDFDGGASAGVPDDLQADPDPDCFAAWPNYETLDVDWVTVGDADNACDPHTEGCFGAVPYSYRISKYEVTNAQYAAFLNAVAATDPNALYHTNMSGTPGTFTLGGITRSGSSGSYSYSPVPGRENKPVNWVGFYDALRLANWLHNARPTGAQDDTTTEDGAYTITASAITDNSITRNPAATIFLTSEDEWYKAAYYDAGSASYFDYPAATDTPIRCAEPGAWANTANCEDVAGDLADVASYTGSASPYGTFDQGGNVSEWNEAIPWIEPESPIRGDRGGALGDLRYKCSAEEQGVAGAASYWRDRGIRVASCSGPCILGCADAFDNDGDGLIDLEDPGCASVEDLTEIDDSGTLVCDDGADNDDDGLVDVVEDPGCDSVDDLTETDDSGALVCDDGLDNDGDGLTDVAEDPGCTSATDPTEIDDSGTLVCDDGLDNDDDGRIDFPEDPGCGSATDLTEEDTVCDDGLDNDGDGLVDAADPGCPTALDPDELTPQIQCDDGADNDFDGLIDSADPQCFSPFAGRERYVACGAGFELALLLPPLMWLRERRRLRGRQQ